MVKNEELHQVGERVLAKAYYKLDFLPWYANPIITDEEDYKLRMNLGSYTFLGFDFTKRPDGKPAKQIYRSELQKLKKGLEKHPSIHERLINHSIEKNIGWLLTRFYTDSEFLELRKK